MDPVAIEITLNTRSVDSGTRRIVRDLRTIRQEAAKTDSTLAFPSASSDRIDRTNLDQRQSGSNSRVVSLAQGNPPRISNTGITEVGGPVTVGRALGVTAKAVIRAAETLDSIAGKFAQPALAADAERLRDLEIRTAVQQTSNLSERQTNNRVGVAKKLAQEVAATTLATLPEASEAAALLARFRITDDVTFGKTFNAASDLSAVGFGSLRESIIALGRAIENPNENLEGLDSRFEILGRSLQEKIQSTPDRNDQIKLILKAVNDRVKGSGALEAGGSLTLAIQNAATETEKLKAVWEEMTLKRLSRASSTQN